MTFVPTVDAGRAAALFQALSDEKRLRILSMLSGGEHCVCELTEALDIGQSLLSFHLKTLKDAGLVADRRDGRWVYYSVIPEALTRATSALTDLSTDLPGAPAREPRC